MSQQDRLREEKYSEFFRKADQDGDGELDYGELLDALRASGYKGTDTQVMKFFKQCDTSGDGKISYEEYMTAMGIVPERIHQMAHYRRIFEHFDKDGSGDIDRDELGKVFAELGQFYSDAELERMIAMVDKDGDGKINYEEFISHVFGA